MRRKGRKRVVVAAAIAALLVAAALYIVPLARDRSENVAFGKQWAGVLKKHPTFSGRRPGPTVDVTFTYAAPNDEDLARLRTLYDLDAIAGQGPEPERIINLMRWVYRLTGHANEPEIPKELNAFNLIRLAKEHMQINCYMKTVILNEVYLATGWPSRQTHLLPSEKEEVESHFVTSVYASTLGKWVLMDPDMGVYLTDEKGTLLGVSEIRSRMIAGRPLVVNDVDETGRLARARDTWSNFTRGVDYLWFLSEFLFKIRCPQRSLFNQASEPNRVMVELIPDGYRGELLQQARIDERGRKIISINDEGLFWQPPSGLSVTSP
jgi:hypothetical protein